MYIQIRYAQLHINFYICEGIRRRIICRKLLVQTKLQVQLDLFQIGCVGLIKAIDNFDTTLNVKFSTYAVPMIIGEIRRYLRDNNSIRVSRSLRDTAYKAIYAREKLCKAAPERAHDYRNCRRNRHGEGGYRLCPGCHPKPGKPV